MARIFGREASTSLEGLAAAARQMLGESYESSKAIARNLINDGRVSQSRAEEFARTTREPDCAAAFRRALVDYVRDFVSRDADASYLAASNLTNFVDPKPSIDLVHVVNVSSAVRRAAISPKSGFDPAIVASAAEVLTGIVAVPERELNDVVDEVLTAEFLLREARPVWAGAWKEFERHIDRTEPASWNRCLGVWRSHESLQMVLRYSSDLVERLIRPTQLDSGDNHYHFPSPERIEAQRGGFAMNLGAFVGRFRTRLPSIFILRSC